MGEWGARGYEVRQLLGLAPGTSFPRGSARSRWYASPMYSACTRHCTRTLGRASLTAGSACRTGTPASASGGRSPDGEGGSTALGDATQHARRVVHRPLNWAEQLTPESAGITNKRSHTSVSALLRSGEILLNTRSGVYPIRLQLRAAMPTGGHPRLRCRVILSVFHSLSENHETGGHG